MTYKTSAISLLLQSFIFVNFISAGGSENILDSSKTIEDKTQYQNPQFDEQLGNKEYQTQTSEFNERQPKTNKHIPQINQKESNISSLNKDRYFN